MVDVLLSRKEDKCWCFQVACFCPTKNELVGDNSKDNDNPINLNDTDLILFIPIEVLFSCGVKNEKDTLFTVLTVNEGFYEKIFLDAADVIASFCSHAFP